MKKFITLSLVLFSTLFLVSCNKESSTTNPLTGTKWTTSYADYLMVLEFTSNTNVTGYFAKSSGAYYGGQINGTYNYSSDGTITFSNMTYQWIYAYYKLENGQLNGSLLNTFGKQTINIEKGEWNNWNRTWNK